MLSILIPVYNFNITNLINHLIKQIKRDSIMVEILILDDGSHIYKKENRQLKKHNEIKYFEFETNRGRSFARNFLAERASYSYLLFMDCDVQIIQHDFLIKYYHFIKQDVKVVCGGLVYPEKHLIKKEQLLHWYYGVKKESKSLSERSKHPYQSFSSFNFLINRDLFLKIRFPEQINTYGHEDTCFGIILKRQKIPILHIDNPLMHIGIEESKIYLKKIEESVKNIDKLFLIIHDSQLVVKEVKLLRYIKIFKKFNLIFTIIIPFQILKPVIIKNLLSRSPLIFLMNFYKLGFYFTQVNNLK